MSSSNWTAVQKVLKANQELIDTSLFTEDNCRYPAEVGHYIVKGLLNGISLIAILDDLRERSGGLIDISQGAVHYWQVGGQQGGAAGVLAGEYARTREAQAARLGQQAVEIVDKQAKGEGDFRTARVALDGSRWLTGRLDKSRWSDNVNVQHSGSISLDQIVQESQEKRSSVLARAQQRVIEGEAVRVDDRQTESGKQADE